MSELEDQPLSAEEVLRFGPVVEAQVWHGAWLQESRAPIAVNAGRAKLGRIFNDEGVGKMAVIRPCISRGRRVRGLHPIYTERMLESHAGVFAGWPQYLDHAPAAVSEALAKAGRSVKDLGGQILKSWWQRDFAHPDDARYGYRRGAVLAESWATPFVRKLVGENPNLLHTSINAWPTSGKPGSAPWRPSLKGMIIEGIRSVPQGSVDYVVRGGAGGRLLVTEGLEEEGAWPAVGDWSEDDVALVVSVAESFYASPRMADVTLPTRPNELADWLEEHAPHLLPALQEADGDNLPPQFAKKKKKKTDAEPDEDDQMKQGLTEDDVRRLLAEAQQEQPTVEEFEAQLTERYETLLTEREEQRALSTRACRLIESAEGIPASWKADLRARYSMLPTGPMPALVLQESDLKDGDGNELTEQQALDARVTADLEHTRQLIAEARGKPRIRGEGGAKPDRQSSNARKRSSDSPYWRREFVSMGIAESEDKAAEAFGGTVTGD